MMRDAMSCNFTTIDVLVTFAAHTIAAFDLGLLKLWSLVDVVGAVSDGVPATLLATDDAANVVRFNEFRFSFALAVVFVKKSPRMRARNGMNATDGVSSGNNFGRLIYLFVLLSAMVGRPLRHICLWSRTIEI